MREIFFHIPILGTPIHGYGVMMVVGFLAGMYLAQFLARKSRLNPEIFANAAILALVSGVAGARLSHVLENWSSYTNPALTFGQNLFNAVNIREGGLTYYGGFLVATPTLIIYALRKKVPLPLGMDIIAPCLMVGLAFGRIGCFVHGCCYGSQCNLPWAAEFPYGSDPYVTEFYGNVLKKPVPRDVVQDDTGLARYMDRLNLHTIQEPLDPQLFRELGIGPGTLKGKDELDKEALNPATGVAVANAVVGQTSNGVHPTQIYSSIVAFAIAAFCVAYFTVRQVPGRVFAGMIMIEAAFRYVLELLRVEPPVIGRGSHSLTWLPGQSYSMCISFGLVIAGAVLWHVFGRIHSTKLATSTSADAALLGKSSH